VIELGGSIGVISCLIRRHIDEDRKLIVVEADPRLVPALQANLDANGCSADVTVLGGAISYGGTDKVEFAVGATSVSWLLC